MSCGVNKKICLLATFSAVISRPAETEALQCQKWKDAGGKCEGINLMLMAECCKPIQKIKKKIKKFKDMAVNKTEKVLKNAGDKIEEIETGLSVAWKLVIGLNHG